MPIELAGYVPMLDAVADRASVRGRGRVTAGQPILYQALHLLVGELVAQLHRRVARYGGQDPLLSAIPGAVPFIAETASLNARAPRAGRASRDRFR